MNSKAVDRMLAPIYRDLEVIADLAIAHASSVVMTGADPVMIRGVRWYYIRGKHGELRKSADLLLRIGVLRRWSKKSPDLVRFK